MKCWKSTDDHGNIYQIREDKQTHRQTNRQTDRRTNKQTDTQTNKQTNKHTDKQTNRQTNTQTNKQTDTQTNKQTDRHTHTNKLTKQYEAIVKVGIKTHLIIVFGQCIKQSCSCIKTMSF